MIEIDSTIAGEKSNSYVSMDFAITYFDSRLYSGKWDAATVENKTRSLLMAASLIDSHCIFFGERYYDSQNLEFPRKLIASDKVPSIPRDIFKAQCEMSLALLEKNRVQDSQTLGISSVSVGPIEMDFDKSFKSNVFPDIVMELLAQYGTIKERETNSVKFVRLVR